MTGTTSSSAQGFAGQVQRAMELSTEFESIVSEMKAENNELSMDQIAIANEQFLTVKMAELKILKGTYMQDKIYLGQLLATGIFTALSLIAPSLAGFNLYAISKLGGSIGSKINARSQNKFLATRNAAMLDKNAMDLEMQKTELGKKPVNTQPENNLPKNIPRVPILTEGAKPLLERTPVEFATAGVNYFSALGFENGRPITHHQVIQEAINEEIKQKTILIRKSQEKVIALSGGITAQGDLKQTLETIKTKYNSREFAKIAETLTKYYEAIHTGKAISDIEGIYNAKAYHILRYISEKINNDEILNNFEESALDFIIDIMKSAQGSYKNIYSGLFSRDYFKNVLKPNGKPSGVAPFYKIFLSKIAKTLYRNGIINTDPDTNLIKSVQEFTVAIGESKDYLWGRITRIKSGVSFGLPEDVLYGIYVSLENLISSSLPKSISYIKYAHDVMNELQQDFDFITFIQGDMSKNKFYGEARLMVYKIYAIIVDSTTIPNFRGTLSSLDFDVLDNAGMMGLYNMFKDKKEPPSLEKVASLRVSIVDNLGPYISSTQLDRILYLVDDFKASILSYHGGIDLLSDYKVSYRKALISDLINSKFTPILQQCYSIGSLSDLLFGNRKDLSYRFFYHNSEEIYGQPYLYILQHIKLRVSLWTTSDFKAEGSIDQTSLDLLKEEITKKIDRFITYDSLSEYQNAYDISFTEEINYLTRYVIEGYEKEHKVIQEYYRAVTAFTGNSKISLRGLARKTGISRFPQASEGKHFSLKTFRKMVSVLEEFIKKDTGTISRNNPKYDFMARLDLDQRQKYYEDAKNTIRRYMKEFGIDRPKNWGEEYVKGYHIMKLLKRNLGFDILSFKTLDKSIFEKGSKGFARHHFRNDFFRKLSNFVQDLILTDKNNHRKYESYSEAKILVILNGFDKMMEMEGPITKSDVINIFKGNEWVLNGPDGIGGKKKNQGWFFSGNFDGMLNEFNERKNKLRTEEFDQFLKDNYDTVYERFYLNFPHGTSIEIADADGFYSLVVPHPWLGDFAMWMNFDAGFWYPEY